MAALSLGGRELCASVPAALLGTAALGVVYVGCLYVRADYRRQGGRAPDRNDPRVIRQRFVRVGIASALAPFVSVLALALPGRSSPCAPGATIPHWFGLWASTPAAFMLGAALPLGITVVLFLGPLVMAWLERDPYTPAWLQLFPNAHGSSDPLHLVRNLLVGPLSEEWVFRACACPLLASAGLGDGANVFVSAVVFGLAHVHHVFDADVGWVAVAVQFTYTSLFGAYSSYLFLRSGQLIGPLLAHSFCNSQGLPPFGRVPGHPQAELVGGAFVLGLGAFIALVTLDANYRPALFASIFWRELGA